MRRDMELVRKILLYVEAKGDGSSGLIQIDDYEQTLIDYHVDIMIDAGLLKGKPLRGGNRVLNHGVILTWDGHDFLDSIKNENVWNKIKGSIRDKGLELGNLPFMVLKDYVKEKLNEILGIS